MEIIRGPLTWAFVITIGGVMLTPDGINIIVTNPAIRMTVGAILIALGVIGFASFRRKSTRG